MLLLFSGVSLAVSQKKNQPMGGIPAIFWSIFVGLPSPGKPHLEEKSSFFSGFSLSVDDGSEIRRKSPVEMVSVSQIAIFKGSWPWFLEMYPVTLLSGAVGFRLPRMRIDLLAPKRFPGWVVWFLGSLGVGWLSHKSCAAGAWCSWERLLHVGQAIET